MTQLSDDERTKLAKEIAGEAVREFQLAVGQSILRNLFILVSISAIGLAAWWKSKFG